MTNVLFFAIELMVLIESGGNWNAMGDHNRAAGGLQIHPCVVVDVNRLIGYDRYCLADRFDKVKSKEMAQIYLTHYCSEKRLGRVATVEDYVRCWNGGPDFFKATGKQLAKLNHHWAKAERYLGDKMLVAFCEGKELPVVERVRARA